MPAEITTGPFCASWFADYVVPGSRPGVTYRVSINGTTSVHCTCPAFKFSRDHTCKHVNAVMNQACMWNCQWHDGNSIIGLVPVVFDELSVIPNDRCPNCAGPTVLVRIAV